MNVKKIVSDIKIRPTDRKIKQAKKVIESGLPKEMPIEKPIYITSEADIFERAKNSIQISIDNMKDKTIG